MKNRKTKQKLLMKEGDLDFSGLTVFCKIFSLVCGIFASQNNEMVSMVHVLFSVRSKYY